MNIQIFGSLLGNAICSRNCINIIDLMNRAIDYNLEMNEKVLKLLDAFKRETMENIAKQVNVAHIYYYFIYNTE